VWAIPEPKDIEAISRLVRRCDEQCGEWAPRCWMPAPRVAIAARWRQRLTRPDLWARLVIEDGGLIGVVACEGACVASLYVEPERSGRGVGSELLRRAERAMLERRVSDAVLWTPERAPGRRFYERRGWRADGRRAVSSLSSLPAVAYVKELRSSAPAEAVRAGENGAQAPDV